LNIFTVDRAAVCHVVAALPPRAKHRTMRIRIAASAAVGNLESRP